MQTRSYQRRYLRAPFWQDVLYADEDFVFKGKAKNISERGLLLSEIGHFPQTHIISFMTVLPQLPRFKNYDLDKLRSFNPENLVAQVVRFKAQIVRRFEIGSEIDGVFLNQIGLSIEQIHPHDQQKINQYVEVFSSNLIYLLVLIDNLNTDKNNLEKFRILSEFLGYNKDEKLALLRKQVEDDYSSLQWN